MEIRLITLVLISAVARTETSQSNSRMQSSNRQCLSNEEQQVESCLQPMISYATSVQSHGLLPLEGIHVFQHLCGLFDEFKKCVRHLQCESIGPKAMEASYGYMCGPEGYPKFVENIGCFVQVEDNTSYKTCKDVATAEINQLRLNDTHENQYFSSLCHVMRSYLQCSKSLIFDKCGVAAWQLISKVTKDSIKITMPACSIEDIVTANQSG